MCEKIKVIITAESKVYYHRVVEMDKANLDKYEKIVNSWLSRKSINCGLANIVGSYGFNNHGEIEEITFELIKD